MSKVSIICREEKKEPFELRIDEIIRRLVHFRYEDSPKLTYKECLAISLVAQSIFANENTMLELVAPIYVCGDIHGQFRDLLRLFDMCGFPPNKRFLFLGDYVDRGNYGLECICLLFSLKIRYPKDVFLLRGNHECESINRCYGFRDEIKSKFCSSKLWRAFLKPFDYLPICATIDNSIFCCHGGLSPYMLDPQVTSLKDFVNNIKRPCNVILEGLVCDILWSDPTDLVEGQSPPNGWEDNERGCSWTFGYDIIEKFLEKFDLDLIVRAHQVVQDGYEFFCNRKLLTVFSAPNYCGKFDNAGGVFQLEKNFDTPHGIPPIIEGKFLILQPNYNLSDQFQNLKKCNGKVIN